MSTIRLTITPEIEEIIAAIETNYKPLSRVEVIKLALAEVYRNLQDKNSVKFPSQADINSKSINQKIKYTYDQATETYTFLSAARSSSTSIRMVTPRFKTKKFKN